jgi:alpha-amylase/alpha-mannosidase (GH57 family)
MTYTLFVPSSWSNLLTEEELQWFFMQQFWNMAREAMLARSILRTGEYFEEDLYEFGLAAGEHSRGMAYGEAINLD